MNNGVEENEFQFLEGSLPEQFTPGTIIEAWNGDRPATLEEAGKIESFFLEHYFTPAWLSSLDALDDEMMERLETIGAPKGDTSFKAEHDMGKVEWLRAAGIKVPESWVSFGGPRHEAHPYIVTLTILVKWVRAMQVQRLRMGLDQLPPQHARYYNGKVVKRLNFEGDRMPSGVDGMLQEEFIRHTGGTANPSGTVSPSELWAMRELIGGSYSKR